MKSNVILAYRCGLMACMGAWCLDALAQPAIPRWVYDAGAGINGSPALGTDGTVYIGAGGNLCAITNAGSVASNKWIIPVAAFASPAVASDGTIYSVYNGLYAINPAGSQKWSCPFVEARGSPAIGPDNTTYVTGRDALYGISVLGTTNWLYPSGQAQDGSPAIGPDRTIYVISQEGCWLSAFTPVGVRKWSTPFGTAGRLAGESVAIDANGTVYVPGGDALYAFSPGGTSLWSNPQGALSGSSVAIGKDGTIYVTAIANFGFAGYGLSLAAIAPSGNTKWQVATNLQGNYGAVLGTPAIDSAGTIYAAAYNRLFAFSPSGVVQWIFDAGGVPSDTSGYTYTSPTIGPDGTIYATFGSRLYAFTGTNALADSPWPMYRQNPRHTGKVEKPSLQKPQKRSDANFQFELLGQISNTFNIEASTNLSNWISLTSFVATTVPMEITDLSATNSAMKFYRAIQGP